MATAPTNKNDVEFEPDFEVTKLPVGELKKAGVKEVEKLPEVEDEKPAIDLKEKREGARSSFSLILLSGFIGLLVLGLVLGFFMEGSQIDNTREILLTISGILSGPMGFVVGYYFRRSEE